MSGVQGLHAATASGALTVAVFVMLLIFVLDVAAVGLLGLWLGLRSRQATGPLLQTLARVMAVPTFIFGGLVVVLLSGGGPRSLDNYAGTLVFLWFLVSAVNAGICIFFALAGLQGQFRELATYQVVDSSFSRRSPRGALAGP
jgi:hypothetical protein